ncbi:serine/threonine-protein kinase [Planobispora siamensis]|uniref:non-specific serine/threonine protein kinase n=1 Tax=Planobispora siamensis TaxID=936338 RepID=A0A8J3SMK2_9ACTN|nr:serine/threonine-protein kinase [Planobispora siamensis]GIH92338.1 hypothetical protein Psi01_29680 [Planobispora siamensis]
MPDREDFAARYRLLRQLGSGGMGTVWLARDEMLHREVAVKELTLPPGADESRRADMVARAVREAQATAQVRHPSVVAIHDVAAYDGKPWIVMELLRGRTLADVVEEHGPLPPRHVAALGAQLLDGLAAAHTRGIQHRDVKPGNVFLTDTGRAVLTDFGIAKLTGEETLTQTGLLIGSPGFIAPERLDGERGGPASDLWSLAATLYYAVEGVAAFDGEPVVRLSKALAGKITPPRLAGPLGPVLMAMMAREPERRPDPDTARWMLTQVADGHIPEVWAPPPAPDSRVPGTDPGLSGPPHRPDTDPGETAPRRPRFLLWIALGATACVVAAAVWITLTLAGGEADKTAFTQPVDLCSLLTPAQVREITRAPQPPQGRPKDEGCTWTTADTGIALIPHTDGDTPQPWMMTPQAAQNLLVSQGRDHSQPGSGIPWEWEEIGMKDLTAVSTAGQPVQGLGEGAFTYDLKSELGQTHTGVVHFRALNLVIEARYSTLSAKPTDADIRDNALKAARWAEAALRSRA